MRQGMIYREEWGNGATLYAGAAGTLPWSGAVVPVTNAWDGSERAGVVTELYPDRHEYRVEARKGARKNRHRRLAVTHCILAERGRPAPEVRGKGDESAGQSRFQGAGQPCQASG